jgi:hypothetical protein
MVRLQRRAVAFTRIRDGGGKKSLTFEVNTALRIHSTHPAAFPAIGSRMFFKSLRYLRPPPIAPARCPKPSPAYPCVRCVRVHQHPNASPTQGRDLIVVSAPGLSGWGRAAFQAADAVRKLSACVRSCVRTFLKVRSSRKSCAQGFYRIAPSSIALMASILSVLAMIVPSSSQFIFCRFSASVRR